MRISDWSSDVCSSDLAARLVRPARQACQRLPVAVDHRPRRLQHGKTAGGVHVAIAHLVRDFHRRKRKAVVHRLHMLKRKQPLLIKRIKRRPADEHTRRSEEPTSELQSLMRISYAVFCLKKK